MLLHQSTDTKAALLSYRSPHLQIPNNSLTHKRTWQPRQAKSAETSLNWEYSEEGKEMEDQRGKEERCGANQEHEERF